MLTVAKLRDLEKQVTKGEISYSRMVELINELTYSQSEISDEEINKEAKYRFTDGHGAEDTYAIDIFINCASWLRSRLSPQKGVSIEDVINYIEKDAEIAIPIEKFFNEDKSHITKKEYGKILIEILCTELRKKYINNLLDTDQSNTKEWKDCGYCKSYSNLCNKHKTCLRDINKKPELK